MRLPEGWALGTLDGSLRGQGDVASELEAFCGQNDQPIEAVSRNTWGSRSAEFLQLLREKKKQQVKSLGSSWYFVLNLEGSRKSLALANVRHGQAYTSQRQGVQWVPWGVVGASPRHIFVILLRDGVLQQENDGDARWNLRWLTKLRMGWNWSTSNVPKFKNQKCGAVGSPFEGTKDDLNFTDTRAFPSEFQRAASLGYDLVVFGLVFQPEACQSNPRVFWWICIYIYTYT